MTKINFKDFPDLSTKVNAENLNKLNNVHVGIEEPSLDEELWVEQSDNLYNYYNAYAYYQDVSNKIQVKPNTEYTYNIGTYTWAQVVIYDASGNELETIGGHSETLKNINFTTQSNASYIKTLFFSGTYPAVLSNIDFTQIKLNYGSVATTKNYVIPNIKVNNNGLYETIANKNIYSSGEVVIGEYMGKPLYRKVIVLPNGTGQTTEKAYNLSDFGIYNVQEIYIANGSYYSLDNFKYPLNYYDGNSFIAFVSPILLKVILGYLPIANSKTVIVLEYTKTTD